MKKVLVIDEAGDVVEMVTYILQTEGYEVLLPATFSFVEEVIARGPNVILLDPWGYKSADDSLKQLSIHPLTRHIPLLIYSTETDLIKLAAKYKAQGCLAKPFDLLQFEKLIAELTAYHSS